MKRTIVSTLAGGMLLAGLGVAAAQSTIVITPEQDVMIRDYVVKEGPAPADLPVGTEVIVGSTLPDTVVLRPLGVPEVSGGYEYVVLGDRTVLVEPATRRVIHIVE